MGLDVVILEVCTKEIRAFPEEIRIDFLDAEAKLRAGQKLSMPLSRPMPEIGPQVHELRFKDRAGIYRIIYVIKKKDAKEWFILSSCFSAGQYGIFSATIAIAMKFVSSASTELKSVES